MSLARQRRDRGAVDRARGLLGQRQQGVALAVEVCVERSVTRARQRNDVSDPGRGEAEFRERLSRGGQEPFARRPAGALRRPPRRSRVPPSVSRTSVDAIPGTVLHGHDDDVDVKICAKNISVLARLPGAALVSLIPMSTSTTPAKLRAAQHNGDGRPAPVPAAGYARPADDAAAVAKPTSAKRRAGPQSKSPIQGLIAKRVAGATEHALDGPNQKLMRAQKPVWDALNKYYFRLETSGWDRLPGETSLLIGNHSGGSLTMDAWTFVFGWWLRFGTERVLHPTAHDVLMAAPVLGDYFRQVGVIPASRPGVTAALDAGCDVIIWPGGDVDAMRNWRKRDQAVLGGRKGFVRQAIRSGVPIVPVASVGGHDTVFVLSEGQWIANGLDRISGLKRKLRGTRLPIVLGIPFGLTIETIPTHLPLPAKIRTELLDPIYVDTDPERVNDRDYVNSIYREVESAIQDGMDRLAKRRRFPIFG